MAIWYLGYLIIAFIAFLLLFLFYWDRMDVETDRRKLQEERERRRTDVETDRRKLQKERERLQSEFGVKERYTDVAIVNENLYEPWDYLKETDLRSLPREFVVPKFSDLFQRAKLRSLWEERQRQGVSGSETEGGPSRHGS